MFHNRFIDKIGELDKNLPSILGGPSAGFASIITIIHRFVISVYAHRRIAIQSPEMKIAVHSPNVGKRIYRRVNDAQLDI